MENSGKNEASSSSSSSIPPKFKYNIFLSFCGKDTRKGFTGHLFKALVRHGFYTFRDDEELVRGERVDDGLLKAIRESRISLVILSENYAESKWCLDELVEIMECRKTLHQIVLPIFYDVEPRAVRAQNGSLAKAFAEHEKEVSAGGRVSRGRVDKWRKALTEVAYLSGWDMRNVSNGDEANTVQEVVEKVWNILAPGLHVAYGEVGLESRLQKLVSLLDMKSDCVRIVAIWGMGGIGKTTIAKKLYNHMQDQFDSSSFLANIREISKGGNGDLVSLQEHGLIVLQEQILSDILRSGTHKISNSYQGIEFLKQRAFCRKVLLVLDDVDDFQQLKKLAIDRDFFGSGSRIIITTRDISSVNLLKVDETYAAQELNDDESLELFTWHCFKEDQPTEEYLDLSRQVVHYAEGLPLALEVLGSYLHYKSTAEWKSAISYLENTPNKKIQEKLKISYDSLDQRFKELFLDIACFFVGTDRVFTVKMLESCGKYAVIGIRDLADRCLVKDEGGKIVMHDLLRDMGREIARGQGQESKNPGKWSRLWNHKDALQVLEDATGTEAVEGIVLNFHELNEVKANPNAFKNMNTLWLLHLNNVHLKEGYEHISRRLMWLCWNGFPLKCLPPNLHMENLVTLDLRYSSLKKAWEGTKKMVKLKFLYLSNCHQLIETPNFSGLGNLEELLVNDCKSLEKVDESVLCLNNLVVLDMKNCAKLRKFSYDILMLKSLESVDLSGCSTLGKYPRFEGSPLKSSVLSFFSSRIFKTKRAESIGLSPYHVLGSGCLKELRMVNCNLSCLPNEVGNLISLETLDLSKNKFRTLPDRMCNLTRLQELTMEDCNLSCLPNEVGNLISLKSLHLDRNNLLTLPDSFCNLPSLGYLKMTDCKLSHLPDRFGMLSSLYRLDLHGNNYLHSLPPSCSDLARLEYLDLFGCERLQSLPKKLLKGYRFSQLPPRFARLAFREMRGCERLQSLPKHPVTLGTLFAAGCTSLESIPIEFNSPDGLWMDFSECNMLAKDNFANNLMERIGQSLSESSQCHGNIDICLPGDEVPSWFKYQSTGSRLSLVVPRRIRGFFLCIVLTIQVTDERAWPTWPRFSPLLYFPISVHKSPPFEFDVLSDYGSWSGDRIRILYVRSDSRGIYYGVYSDPRGIYCGEELEIVINSSERDDGKVLVKKCGINFIYEGDEDDTEMPDEDDTERPIIKKRKIIIEEMV